MGIGTENAQFAPWEDLGGITFVESPSAVSWWDGNRIDIFVKGADTHLWHKVWTSTQGLERWESLGGRLQYNPSAVKTADGRIEILATGSTAQLEHTRWG